MRVLVVDDDAPTRGLIDRVLADEDEVDVVGHAASAEEATALAEGLVPDVIVLDLVLGFHDGRDLVAPLRLASPRASVLVLTALPEADARDSSLAAGADAFHTKSPAVFARLAEELRAVASLRDEAG